MALASFHRSLLRRLIKILGVAGAAALLMHLLRRATQPRLLPPAPPAKQAKSAPTGRVVAITGANGYLGSACVELFLLRGHNVRACVRGKPIAPGYHFLKQAAAALGAEDSLTISGGCALSPGSNECFRTAFAGCDAVVHTAMPMDHSELVFGSDEYARLRRELVDATVRVCEAAADAGVRTLVLTSSSTAVMGSVRDGQVYNEHDWSDAQPGTSAYGMLKSAVERAAVEWHCEHNEPFRFVPRAHTVPALATALVHSSHGHVCTVYGAGLHCLTRRSGCLT